MQIRVAQRKRGGPITHRGVFMALNSTKPSFLHRVVGTHQTSMEENGRGTCKDDSSLVFAINSQRFELRNLDDPSITLLQFLRSQTSFKSPKLSCGEGGCGACVVLLSKYDPELDKVEDFTVSSCLTLLCSLNGCSITTSEGLGNSKTGFHNIHKRFAGFHASQCGFCTPGMCMSFYGALVNAEKAVDDRLSKLTAVEAEKAIASNLCRCTGYRPIADACKSFAGDIDMEDLGINTFWKKGDSVQNKMSILPLYSPGDGVCDFPEFLKGQGKGGSLSSWIAPGNVKELQSLMKGIDHGDETRVKLVVGNTGVGYYKEEKDGCVERYIDLRYVPELKIIKKDETGIKLGAAVTISTAIKALKKESDEIYQKIAAHMEKVATSFVRNSGSIGGNLVMAQRKHFPSDIATILLAAGSYVEVLTAEINEKLTLEVFLERAPMGSKDVLVSIEVPKWKASQIGSRLAFDTYRASPRPLGNALAHLNAAFMAEISETSEGSVMSSCRLAFGAYGTKHAIRVKNAEEFLAGKKVTPAVVYETIGLVKSTVVSDEGASNPEYRSSLAVGFLFNFLSSFMADPFKGNASNGWLNGHSTAPDEDSEATQKSCHDGKSSLLLSSGKQVFQASKENRPVGEAIGKTGAALQASGEAVYVDDIPSPPNCLYGALVCSTKPLARVKDIGFKSNPLPDGVAALISYKDIPKDGENVGSKTMFESESLFADELTRCAGERLAFVVADSQKHADSAANLVVVDYDTESLEPPILTVEEAVKRSSFFHTPPFLQPKPVGDITRGMAEAEHRLINAEMKLESQYYFYMETQTALAIPDEDNCMVVYSSTQCPEYSCAAIAQCLGLPQHNVRVITRRVGGGFGGKAFKSLPVATACALAAHVLRRPVRTYVSRKTDMIMAGGRHPMKITYSVGFKSNGKITALKLDVLINAGISLDVSPIIPIHLVGALKKYDFGALAFDIKLCKTNHSSKSAMRAPGEVQGSFIADSVMEQVASTLSLDVDSVKTVNLHSHDSLKLFYDGICGEPHEYTLISIWDRVARSSSFNERREMVEKFNRCNLWSKRGISRVPIVFEAGGMATPGKVSILSDGSIVVEVGGIELGQGLWTKVKQMAAFCLSSTKCEDSLLERVRVIQADSLSLIQGGITAGSTKSESSCEAIRLCCNLLVERLVPLMEKLQKETGSVRWEMLISQAYMTSVNLSASSYYVPDFATTRYLNYGAAVSEASLSRSRVLHTKLVEVNLLTGETTILRSDLVYDCGQSLNPAVDMGQIEGAFVQGIGFFMLEEYKTNSEGLVTADSTWRYKVPTIDTIPKQFNVEILSSGHHQNRVLSSKASGEPPLLLASSVHCATRAAIKDARKQLHTWGGLDGSHAMFNLAAPATMPVVKELCGLDSVESYLKWRMNHK
ncbi:unnamed protein product [Linum tenue]|uniref:indole-3-acetaldehyde oxidase n=1 Tax=Linum tenue TaxID=586396 RepID=A0AAV0IM33_9ROSI|nr:unnamed protein product [Linum tenue]